MKRSTDRILTTHTGSLPRPAELRALLTAQEAGTPPTAPCSTTPSAPRSARS